MQATAMFSSARDASIRSHCPGAGRFAGICAASSSAEADDELGAHYRRALRHAVDRAERAERRLRARMLELTWPAALSSMVGGFLAIGGLRFLGL